MQPIRVQSAFAAVLSILRLDQDLVLDGKIITAAGFGCNVKTSFRGVSSDNVGNNFADVALQIEVFRPVHALTGHM